MNTRREFRAVVSNWPLPLALSLKLLQLRAFDALGVLTAASLIAVFLSMSLAMHSAAAMRGAYRILDDKLPALDGHFRIEPVTPPASINPDIIELIRQAAAAHGAHAAPYLITDLALSRQAEAADLAPALAKGIDLEQELGVTGIRSFVADSQLDDYITALSNNQGTPILIGHELAAKHGFKVGETVFLIKTGRLTTPPYPVTIAGTFETFTKWDSFGIYAPLHAVQSIFGSANYVSGVAVRASDLDQADSLAESMRSGLGSDYSLLTWRQLYPGVASGISVLLRLSALLQAGIVVTHLLFIFSLLTLIFERRRQEFMTLLALGLPRRALRLTMILVSLHINLIGGLVAAVVSVASCWVINQFRLIQLPPDAFLASYLPLDLRSSDAVVLLALQLGLVILLSWSVATRLSRGDVAQLLRYE